MPWQCIDPQCCCRDHSLASHFAFFLFIFVPAFPCHIKQSTGLHFQGLFYLIAHFIQHQKVNLHTRIVHSPCFHSSLANFAIRCLCSISWDSSPRLWGSLCKTLILLCCSPSTLSSEVPSGQKEFFQWSHCRWAQVAVCDILSLRLILRCRNTRNFQKHQMKRLPKATRSKLRYADPQYSVSKRAPCKVFPADTNFSFSVCEASTSIFSLSMLEILQ